MQPTFVEFREEWNSTHIPLVHSQTELFQDMPLWLRYHVSSGHHVINVQGLCDQWGLDEGLCEHCWGVCEYCWGYVSTVWVR